MSKHLAMPKHLNNNQISQPPANEVSETISETVSNELSASIKPMKRGEVRRQKIIEAADHLFKTKGYAGTSVNEVVKLSGGSLNTLYRYFGNKVGLFEAVLTQKTDELFQPFLQQDFWQGDLRSNLLTFGAALQSVALSEDGIAIYRLAITENNQEQGELQQLFYQKGPQRAIQILSCYLQQEQQKGTVHFDYPELAANQFLEMIKGPFYYPAVFGETLSQEKIDQALHQGVDLFLRGCLQS